MFDEIAHIGIAVKDLTRSIEVFEKLTGSLIGHREEVVDQGVRTAMLQIGGTSIELLEAMNPDSPIAKFIEKRGEGIHHVSFVVADIAKELVRLREHGFQLIDERPRQGVGGYLVAFLHPKSTNGVLIEICQKMQ